jgi:DNA-binding CsgD family transcriptional regulator
MPELSPLQKTVLKMICSDKDNSEIANKLDLSLRYIEKVKTALYTKTKTHSNLGLFKWAVKNKLAKI